MRVYITRLIQYVDNGIILNQILFVNLFGSFLLGITKKVESIYKTRANIYIILGFGTGLCGSLTTYSTWIYTLVDNSLKTKLYIDFILLLLQHHCCCYIGYYVFIYIMT